MNRKEFLKRLGVLTVGATLVGVDVKAMTADAHSSKNAAVPDKGDEKIDLPVKSLKAEVDKPVSVIIIGAGTAARRMPAIRANSPMR